MTATPMFLQRILQPRCLPRGILGFVVRLCKRSCGWRAKENATEMVAFSSRARQLRWSSSGVAETQQGHVAADRRNVVRHRAFGGEAVQVVRTTGFRAGAGHALTAKRLHTDDSA